jgi:hypothetical protein
MKKQKRRLTKKQNSVLKDLFKGSRSEVEVLKKHKISTQLYKGWLADDEMFADEFAFRAQAGKRQCELIIANYAPAAAAKLIALTQGQKEETTRKACLDIISLPLELTQQKRKKEAQDKDAAENISDEIASKMLEILAGDKNDT